MLSLSLRLTYYLIHNRSGADGSILVLLRLLRLPSVSMLVEFFCTSSLLVSQGSSRVYVTHSVEAYLKGHKTADSSQEV